MIALAGVSVFFLVDNPVRSYMLDNQTTTKDDAADVFRTVGEPEVWALVPAVMIGTGLVAQEARADALRASGGHVGGARRRSRPPS